MITHIKYMIIDEIVAFFDSAEKAIPYLEFPIDLLICETKFNGMGGLEFRKLAHKIPVCIFVSSRPELAAEVFETDALDFITKPLKTERLHHSIQKVFNFFEMKEKGDCFNALPGENCIKKIRQFRFSD